MTLALALTAILAVGSVYACASMFGMFGRITMPWQVIPSPPKAVMTPPKVIVPIGTIVEGGTKTTPLPIYSEANLTVNTATQINVTLGGDYSGFTVLNVTIDLVNMTSKSTVYTATVTIGAPSATIPSVAVGTYGIYVGFTATAGYSASCGEATLTFSYPS